MMDQDLRMTCFRSVAHFMQLGSFGRTYFPAGYVAPLSHYLVGQRACL